MSLITISQSKGSGGEHIARRVAETLQLQLYDDQRLTAEAQRMGIRAEDFRGLDEKAPGFFQRLLSNRPELFLDLMETVVYEVARNGQGVIVGHGSQMLLQDFDCALHVFVHAPLARRIERLAQEQNLRTETAEKLIRKSDSAQKGFFQFAFHQEFTDPSHYDLILNTQKLSWDSAARMVIDAARVEEIQACSLTALETMERLGKVKKIQAELLKNGINLATLKIDAEGDAMVVRGFTFTLEEKEIIEEAVQNVPNVASVKADVSVVSPGHE